MNRDEFAMAVAVGMGTAAYVARDAGFAEAFAAIEAYRENWEAKVIKREPRSMRREDIYPKASRYAEASDFGIDEPFRAALAQAKGASHE